MTDVVEIGGTKVGAGQPVYIIGEIGINHNGEMENVRKLIDVAAAAGCNAVKFQKRTPELCVPEAQKSITRETPWGIMTYLEYRHRIELNQDQYSEIDRYAKSKGLHWFASCWDMPSVDFIDRYDPVAYKIASASLTDDVLLRHVASKGKPVILSTGMSTLEEIERAVSLFDKSRLLITHATSTYPCSPDELNLRVINSLRNRYNVPVGYSGHETGLQTTVAAVALGACVIERHITLDRAMWGTDQAASVEPAGLHRLVRDIRVVERAFGDGVKRVYASELPIRSKLRVR
ncbi:MAG TPA: N-acetylneuraminate synthase family protein [Polyangiales bacterium]|nr:N-acetylneuraminate synthase family protein [Polyangiales bacterium]